MQGPGWPNAPQPAPEILKLHPQRKEQKKKTIKGNLGKTPYFLASVLTRSLYVNQN